METCRRCNRKVKSTIRPMYWCYECYDYEKYFGRFYMNYTEYLEWKARLKKNSKK